jgi:putative Ca2+/H+ antiporter (TMEM165/GDT1 family)
VNAIVSSFLLVAAAEMGDKTQLLALSLAARFRRPWPVMAGILMATLANHALAASVGTWVSVHIPARILAAALAVLFIGFGLWALVPDRAPEDGRVSRSGPFLTTAVLFFLAEIGDKTQLATMALAARYRSILQVTVGTTLGMLVADGLAVVLGDRLAAHLQARWIRWVAATLFFGFGIAAGWAAWVSR